MWCYGTVDRQDLMENRLKKLTLDRSYVKFNSLNNFRCKSLPVLKVNESSLVILSVVET